MNDYSLDNTHFLGIYLACLPLFIYIPIVDDVPVIKFPCRFNFSVIIQFG